MNTINEDLQFIRDHQAGVRTAPTYWTGWNSLAHRLAAEVERLRGALAEMTGYRNEVAEAANSHADDARNRQVEIVQLRNALARLDRAARLRMMAEDPTAEERLELLHACEAASKITEGGK